MKFFFSLFQVFLLSSLALDNFAQNTHRAENLGVSLGITPVYYSFNAKYNYFRSDLSFDFRASKKNGILVSVQYLNVPINDLVFRGSEYGLYSGYRRDLYQVQSDSWLDKSKLLLICLVGFEMRDDGEGSFEQSSIAYDIGLRWYFKKPPYLGVGFHSKYIDDHLLVQNIADLYLTFGFKL